MKKTLFAIVVASLFQIITFLVFLLPDDVIYIVKQPPSILHTWVNVWVYIVLFIISSATMGFYLKLGEKLFDYLKKE